MRNVYINEAESIFEPFWDGGESYPGHHKYACINNYAKTGRGSVRQDWASVTVFADNRLILERDTDIDIRGFDTVTARINLPEGTTFRLFAVTDEKKSCIISCNGSSVEPEGKICGEKITHISMEFENNGSANSPVSLFWLGLANSKKRAEMLSRDNGYGSGKWDGCFADNYEIKPHLGVYFNQDELISIRGKIKKPPYKTIFSALEKRAMEYMSFEPEKYIGDFVDISDRRFGRSRDFEKNLPKYGFVMEALAFVGLVNKNADMLKLACRTALSAACSRYWCEGIMGAFPGATWHHRSFAEATLCRSCAKVLDWAGELLTWHGRNMIYDAIIMKGMPRIEADINTMDYIWSMNQGIVFVSPLISTLAVIAKRYPRYADSLDRYEKILFEMWNNYINSDGGANEGPGYWSYSVAYFLWAVYVLSRVRNISPEKYFEKFKNAEKYARAMLSTSGNGNEIIALGDTNFGRSFDIIIPAFFAQTGKDRDFWNSVMEKTSENCCNLRLLDEVLIASGKLKQDCENTEECFIPLFETGMVTLVRNSAEVGKTALFLQSGQKGLSHGHEDKGSFILEAGGSTLLLDRGVCDYSKSNLYSFKSASWHNLLFPENECELHQKTEYVCGKIIKAEYSDGTLVYSTDITEPWDGVFSKNIRSVISPHPQLFVIIDRYEYSGDVSFRLNTYGEIIKNVINVNDIKLYVNPVNWTPKKAWSGTDGTDGKENSVNQLRLYSDCKNMITLLEISKDKSEAVTEKNSITYKNIKLVLENGAVIVNGKKIDI